MRSRAPQQLYHRHWNWGCRGGIKSTIVGAFAEATPTSPTQVTRPSASANVTGKGTVAAGTNAGKTVSGQTIAGRLRRWRSDRSNNADATAGALSRQQHADGDSARATVRTVAIGSGRSSALNTVSVGSAASGALGMSRTRQTPTMPSPAQLQAATASRAAQVQPLADRRELAELRALVAVKWSTSRSSTPDPRCTVTCARYTVQEITPRAVNRRGATVRGGFRTITAARRCRRRRDRPEEWPRSLVPTPEACTPAQTQRRFLLNRRELRPTV